MSGIMVIGGGLARLAAAIECAERGVDGNAIGGLLIDIFGTEMTAASSTAQLAVPAGR